MKNRAYVRCKTTINYKHGA